VTDTKAIAAFQTAQGYDYPIWREDICAANIKAGDHVHIMLALEANKIVGLVHWVDAETDKGPMCHYIGSLVSSAFTQADRFATLRMLSLAVVTAHGGKGRWCYESPPDDTEGITFARRIQADKEIDLGTRIYFEGDLAVAATTPPRTK
jgi:hypothetical protein